MRILSSLACMLCLPVAVAAVERQPSIATALAENYLKSFVEAEKSPLKKAHKGKKEKASDVNVSEIYLAPRAERAIVLNEIFAKSDYYADQYQHAGKVLHPYAWNDLHLFCGTTTTPAYHFLSRINKTITLLGEGALASLLAAPLAKLERVTQRQQFIRFLYENNQIYNDLKGAFQNYKPSEKSLLSFWTATDPLYTKEYDKYLTQLFYTNSTASNKQARSLQIKKILLRDIWNIYAKYTWYPLIVGFPLTETCYLFLKNNHKLSRGAFYGSAYWIWMPIYNLYDTNKQLQKAESPPLLMCSLMHIFFLQ